MYETLKPNNHIIIEQSKRTWETKYVRYFGDGMFKRKFPIPVFDVDHTDGIGTKGHFHWELCTFRNAVLDALAMNINDLHMNRATPYKLQNHIILPKDEESTVRTIATALADECVERDICITGGEFSVDDTDKGIEISICMSGFVDYRMDNIFHEGDILVGLASTGIHANGFTFIRKMMRERGLHFRDRWLTPTRIYDLPSTSFDIRGIQHITGGAFAKMKKRLYNCDAYIHRKHNLVPQDEFKEIYQCHYGDNSMYKIFNCGIGMVLGVEPRILDTILGKVGGEVIGEVRKGSGRVIIESMFSKINVVL